MNEVSIRDLRNHGGEVVDRVAAGERVIVTRAGRPVAELRPLLRAPLSAEALLSRWRRLPALNPRKFQRDVDSAVDARL
jgi:prevent-host-death family protein